jgi:hypothetical protein
MGSLTALRVSPLASGARPPPSGPTIGLSAEEISSCASRRMTKLGSVESEPIPSRALRTVRPIIAAWTFSRPHVTRRPSPTSGTPSCDRALTSGSPVGA